MQHYILLEHLEVAGVGCHDDPRRQNYVELANRLQPYHTVLGPWEYGQLANPKNVVLSDE